MLLTWSFGPVGARAGMPLLNAGADPLDAVIEAATAIEIDPAIDSVGVGGLPDADGNVSLDACVMTNPGRCAGVAAIKRFDTPSKIARAVMERTIHCLLVGSDAEAFALREGFLPSALLTPEARAVYDAWRHDPNAIDRDRYKGWLPPANVEELRSKGLAARFARGGDAPEPPHDTVGILARAADGRLAGVCTTSGMAFKAPGRVGDSPIIGQGLYVEQDAGAACATGTGELIAGVCGSFLAVECMRRGATPLEAAREVLGRIKKRYTLSEEHQVAIIAMNPAGEWASASLRPGFKHTVAEGAEVRVEDPTEVVGV
jgi:isoaspartyl peptidase/L-asparaginase-like protein (Ntn-hydrolase superfamily)